MAFQHSELNVIYELQLAQWRDSIMGLSNVHIAGEIR